MEKLESSTSNRKLLIIFLSIFIVLLIGASGYLIWRGYENPPIATTNAKTQLIDVCSTGFLVAATQPGREVQLYCPNSAIEINKVTDPSVAKLLNSTGKISALKNGTTTISFTSSPQCDGGQGPNGQKYACPLPEIQSSFILVVNSSNLTIHSLYDVEGSTSQASSLLVGDDVYYGSPPSLAGMTLSNFSYDKSFFEPASPSGLYDTLKAISKGSTEIHFTAEDSQDGWPSSNFTINITIN